MIEPWLGIDYEYVPVSVDQTPLGPSFVTSVMDCLRNDASAFGEDALARSRGVLLENTLREIGLWSGLHVPLVGNVDRSWFHNIRTLSDTPYLALDQTFSEQQINRLSAATDPRRAAVILTPSGDVRRLSSGELGMAQFVAQAIAVIENGSLLLLDEPETHLHPNYISKFMDLLQDLLLHTKSIAIIATHSAYVLREVPRQRVNVLQRDGAHILVDAPRVQTFGANIDDLSQFVFLDSSVSPRYRRILERWANTVGRELGIEQVLEQHGENLSPVTLSLIARTIRNTKDN